MFPGDGLLVAGHQVGVHYYRGDAPTGTYAQPGAAQVPGAGGTGGIEGVALEALDEAELAGESHEGHPQLGIEPRAESLLPELCALGREARSEVAVRGELGVL